MRQLAIISALLLAACQSPQQSHNTNHPIELTRETVNQPPGLYLDAVDFMFKSRPDINPSFRATPAEARCMSEMLLQYAFGPFRSRVDEAVSGKKHLDATELDYLEDRQRAMAEQVEANRAAFEAKFKSFAIACRG